MATSDYAGTATLDWLETSTIQLFDHEQREPARTLLPTVVRHLDDVATALTASRKEQERRRLRLIRGETAALAGWLVLEQEDVHDVHRYWNMALTVAEQIRSKPLLACIQTYMSHVAAEQSDPTSALRLACTALSHAGDDSRAKAWTAARVAQEAAALGDQAMAFVHLDMAIDLANDFTTASPNQSTAIKAPDDMPPWARFVDTAYIWSMVANAYSTMNITSDAYMAAIYARGAVGAEPTKARALTLAEIAYAFAAVWQLDEAVWYAAQAAELAEQLEIKAVKKRLRAMVKLLPWSEDTSGVVERVMAD